MLITLIVIIGLSLLVLGHEAGHFFAAKFFKLKVDEFGFGFPPRMFAKKWGETEYSFNWLPFGGFVKIAGENGEFGLTQSENTEEDKSRLYFHQPAWKRAIIIGAGVTINFIIGWFLLSAVFMIGTPSALVISGVQENSPAAAAALQSGDILKNFPNAESFIAYVNEHRGEEINLLINRGGEELSVSVTPRVTTSENEGAVGVMLADAGTAPHSFPEAMLKGLQASFMICQLTLIGLGSLISNLFMNASIPSDVVGPVGIFGVAQDTGKIGLIYLVHLISLISLNLAVVNLIPFPALDGGRLFMIGIEKLKGSPISYKTEALMNGISFVFLLFLMVLITAQDIGRLFF